MKEGEDSRRLRTQQEAQGKCGSQVWGPDLGGNSRSGLSGELLIHVSNFQSPLGMANLLHANSTPCCWGQEPTPRPHL